MNAASNTAQKQHLAAPSPTEKIDPSQETLEFLDSHIRRLQRSLRRARPISREGIEASLDLMRAAIAKRLS